MILYDIMISFKIYLDNIVFSFFFFFFVRYILTMVFSIFGNQLKYLLYTVKREIII
jgi:hypothetical protein